MGGLICQEIAVHYPERAIAFVLSDAAGFYPPPFSTDGLRERLAYLKTAAMEFALSAGEVELAVKYV